MSYQKLCQLRTRAVDAGINIPSYEYVQQFLTTLPAEYAPYIGSLIMSLTSHTLETAHSALLAIEAMLTSNNTPVALAVAPAHAASQPARGGRPAGGSPFPGKCHYCGKVGHKKAECRSFSKDKKKPGGPHADKSGPRYKPGAPPPPPPPPSASAAVSNGKPPGVFVCAAANNPNSDNILLDTGASVHMVRDHTHLHNMTKAKHVTLSCAVGTFRTLWKGTLHLITTTGATLLLHDVYLEPNLPFAAIVSFGLLEEIGYSITAAGLDWWLSVASGTAPTCSARGSGTPA